MTENRVLFDYDRAARTSVPEAVFCQSKSREVIYSLLSFIVVFGPNPSLIWV